MSVSVYLCVCVSVCEHIAMTSCPTFTKFLCMLRIAVGGWLLAVLRYDMYIGFYGGRHICTQWTIWDMSVPLQRMTSLRRSTQANAHPLSWCILIFGVAVSTVERQCSLTPLLHRIGCVMSRRRLAPRWDESIVQGVPGVTPAMYNYIVFKSHSHGNARVLQGRRWKSMGEGEIWPPATQKPLNRWSPKFV